MDKVDLSLYNNNWYQKEIGAGKLKQLIWYYTNMIFFNNYLLPFSGLKVSLLKLFGARIGKGAVIKPKVNIKYPWKLIIGDNCWIGENVWIDNLATLTMGNSVCLSQGAFILCGNHHFGKPAFDLIVKPIILEDGVWIGARSVVCPGVIAYSHAVLAVQSVANTNLDRYSIYRGNPATNIKSRIIEP